MQSCITSGGISPDFLEKVNTFFEGQVKGFVSVEDEQLPRHWYGGGKYLECELAIGAFNHLDVEGLVRHLCSLIGPIRCGGLSAGV